jgi:EAL domain-containing protein (putative c-di-GMP-specific phosphodiesterase class I)
LIENIAHSKSNRKTVEAIQIFAQKLGAKTVAEYVTNKETYDVVKEIGIDYAQGFYIGKPQREFLDEKVAETV